MAEPPCEIGGSATGLSATGRLTHTAVGVGDPLGAAAASHRPGACKKSTHGRLFTGAISMPVTCVMGWAKEEVLDFKPAPRLEQVGDRCSKQMEDGKHRVE